MKKVKGEFKKIGVTKEEANFLLDELIKAKKHAKKNEYGLTVF